MITCPIYIALTAVTVEMPASANGVHAAETNLVGVGLFIAKRNADGRWRFERRAHAISAGEPEGTLLEWITSRLPGAAMMIGWNVDHQLVPALLDAAATAPPAVAHRFLERLTHLLKGGVVDIALRHGGAGAPTLNEAASDMAIYAPVWNVEVITGAWAIGAVDRLRRDLADEAMAIWRTFVRTAGVTGLDAEAATDAWVLRRASATVGARSSSAT